MARELLIPDPAIRESQSLEMIRVWIAENGLHCALNIGFYDDNPSVYEETAWGIIIADICRHVANGLAERGRSSSQHFISLIRDEFLKELDLPSSNIRGGFVEDQ